MSTRPRYRCSLLMLAGLLTAVVAAPLAAQAPRVGTTPDWLQETLSSRVETAHLVAVADPIDRTAIPANGKIILTLRLTPRAGMRIYAHDVTGYVPLSVRLDAMEGAIVEPPSYPSSEWYEFPPTRERSRVYSTSVTVKQAVVLSEAARRRFVRGEGFPWTGTLRYQACDDRLCYRVTNAQIAWTPPP